MTKNSTCANKQHCDPPSADSEASYQPKSDKDCVKACPKDCKKDCCIPKCDCYTPEELVCLYKDAVVEIHSEFILLGQTGTAPTAVTGATGGTPLGSGTRTDVILEGNGFFIKGHYIVAPAHLVLLPPSLSSVVNRFPIFDPSNVTLGNFRNQLVRASRILVSVFNVNGCCHSFVYEADLLGVDGAGDIAVLRINYGKQWNLCNPCVGAKHPYFKFGSSRAAKDGEKVYLIGDYISNFNDPRLFNAVGAISEGLLSDHRHLEYSGWVLPETVLVSAGAYAFSSGLPIMDCQGRVIGMQTTDLAAVSPDVFGATGVNFFNFLTQRLGSGFVAGPSEFFMRRVVKTILKSTCSRKLNCQLRNINDPAGSFSVYSKAYAGIAYEVFTGIDYDITTSFVAGDLFAGLPRIRLSSTGEFLSSPSCKELVGIKVLGLAGINPDDIGTPAPGAGVTNGFFFVPGGTGTIAPFLGLVLPTSPFLGRLQPGDVITHINNVALGDLCKQIAPTLITWRLCGGDQITITYRRGGNALNTGDNSLTENYENIFTITVALTDFPAFMDYPYYAINIFPLLSTFPTPGFIFPVDQALNPQLPARIPNFFLGAGGGVFHPAF